MAAAAVLAAAGIELFGWIRSAPDPDRCSFEITVGENIMELTPAEVVGLIRNLLQHSR